jgi:hypothetical protein
MDNQRVFKMSFAGVYPHYVEKATKKGRTKKELDEVICWLTGYSPHELAKQIKEKRDLETFFAEAPALNPKVREITGVVCGVRIEDISHPLIRKIRYMDNIAESGRHGYNRCRHKR